ncbi:sensor histidine kinase [Paenibacillus roseipurpureus]|uniref:Heme sensor protein HssS n=1 Tax=Paenibacillus roseopurpureus TaxID=2918901 RepID=A0AA96RMB9_9BACL|nr:HAMP domain-containing sensor histidine kinase [Paenibacillus sp. MBLB1832]WNR44047.1 HAMP domain-containing sensor histidine kinase [Paenibacillus sp. MBLB1832]
MIKTLYVRIVMTFTLVVVISLLVSTLLASKWFSEGARKNVSEDLFRKSQQIQQIVTDAGPVGTIQFLDKLAILRDYKLFLFEKDGGAVLLADHADYTDFEPFVTRVLHGETVKVFHPSHAPGIGEISLGVPIQLNGEAYAMFIQPDLLPQLKSFQSTTAVILLSVLTFGSLLILVAARYLVKPIQRMTVATRGIAKGNFEVDLKIKSKDELGELAQSIQHMARELGQLERMRQDFVSNVSHEMQSPLTSISGFAQVLSSEVVSEEDRLHYAHIIHMESQRLSRLSENLLKLTSLESENHPFHSVTYRLDRQLQEIVLAAEPLWVGKHIDIGLDVVEASIKADKDQLTQVWNNLLYNAIKFTPEGGQINMVLSKVENAIVVEISDSGVGISEGDMKRIFERFYKADPSRQWKVEGNGLGLAIVKKIIDIHQGIIEVESKLGKGTTFRIKLPYGSL